jgi:hypothetical protein
MNDINTYFQKNVLLVWILFFISITIFTFYLALFFISLSSLVSDYSWGDVAYHHQIFYNFLHDRPFQTSVYWSALANSVNQYAYLNMINIHLYLSPFLFSFIYYLIPNLYGLYFTLLVVNYISLAFFLWKLVCLFTVEDRLLKYLLVMSFLLTHAFTFLLIGGKASPILLGTPFLLAAYYFLQRERYGLYYICSLLFCLSYDDCGLFFISFLGYVFLFERKHLKPAVVTALLGLFSVVLVIGILQPMARINMPGKSVASVFDALGIVWDSMNSSGFLFRFINQNGKLLLMFGSLFLAFTVILLLSKRSGHQDLYRCLGLIFLAPLSHWASIVVGVGVHFMPVTVFTFIAITLIMSKSELNISGIWTQQKWLALALIGFYFVSNLFVFSYLQRHYIGNEYAEEKKSNAHCLQVINRIVPNNDSLTYWTACGIDGFLGNRSNLWRFPHFFDRADFLVMQKNAKNTFFQAKIISGQDIYQSLMNGTYHSTGAIAITDNKMIDAVSDMLVKANSSHTIVFDDPEVVVLKRKERFRFEQPSETIGFGFFVNFPKYLKAKFPL